MIIIYNILQIFCLILFSPIILTTIAFTPKYRTRIIKQIGFGLKKSTKSYKHNCRTIWIHALSVGEVASVIPLVIKLKQSHPQVNIIFSTTTTSGQKLAKEKLSSSTEMIFFAPLDILPISKYFVKILKPDAYILVETDFWPNLLTQLNKHKTPTILINGRISNTSLKKYIFFRSLFSRIFSSFTYLCMQTEYDRQNMIKMGVSSEQSIIIGNLKYNLGDSTTEKENDDITINISPKKLLLICGSTHKGEEKIILDIFKNLLLDFPDLYLLIAPRNTDRSAEILRIGYNYGLQGDLRTDKEPGVDFTVLNTIGELKSLYKFADIAFIGGSLVNEGGHNPLEASAYSIPIIFGPHMDDFIEISDHLVSTKGAIRVNNHTELKTTIISLLKNKNLRKQYGLSSFNHYTSCTNTADNHIKLIIRSLDS